MTFPFTNLLHDAAPFVGSQKFIHLVKFYYAVGADLLHSQTARAE